MHLVFTNEPPIEEWMSAAEKDFRNSGKEYVQNAAVKELTFKGKTEVRFFSDGVASLVALVHDGSSKQVFKTCFKKKRAMKEAKVLDLWRGEGVMTPKIYSKGYVKEHSYFFMEYINAQTVAEREWDNPSQKSDVAREVGGILTQIHSVHASGFGDIEIHEGNIQGKYRGIKDFRKKCELKGVDEALNILSKSTQEPVVGHFDYGLHHIFDTSPFTVFDPDPEVTLPMIDLGFFLLPVIDEDQDMKEMRKEVLRGYKENGGTVNEDELAAGLVFKVHQKAQSLRAHPDTIRLKRADLMCEKAGTIRKAGEYLQTYLL